MSQETREGLCQVCDREYVNWFAPNPLWNATIRSEGRDEYAFLCLSCFAALTVERGVHTTSFVLATDTTPYDKAASLAYTLREIVIQGEEALADFRGLDRQPVPA